jgi:2'-5' RNA ligase
VRLFLAIQMTDEILVSLGTGIDRLRETRAAVRWVKPEGMHLTVKFFGETQPEQVDALAGAMSCVCGLFDPFQLCVTGLGAYPDPRRPRVLWAGVEEPSGALNRLWVSVEKEAARLRWKREKRGFSPHITLGRVKGPINLPRLTERINLIKEQFWGEQEVRELILYSSGLRPDGAVYEKLRVFPLGEN